MIYVLKCFFCCWMHPLLCLLFDSSLFSFESSRTASLVYTPPAITVTARRSNTWHPSTPTWTCRTLWVFLLLFEYCSALREKMSKQATPTEVIGCRRLFAPCTSIAIALCVLCLFGFLVFYYHCTAAVFLAQWHWHPCGCLAWVFWHHTHSDEGRRKLSPEKRGRSSADADFHPPFVFARFRMMSF